MDEGLLHYYNTEWIRYTTAMKYINHIFQYLVLFFFIIKGIMFPLYRTDIGLNEKQMMERKRFMKYTQYVIYLKSRNPLLLNSLHL